jgi:hypothetical protein
MMVLPVDVNPRHGRPKSLARRHLARGSAPTDSQCRDASGACACEESGLVPREETFTILPLWETRMTLALVWTSQHSEHGPRLSAALRKHGNPGTAIH